MPECNCGAFVLDGFRCSQCGSGSFGSKSASDPRRETRSRDHGVEGYNQKNQFQRKRNRAKSATNSRTPQSIFVEAVVQDNFHDEIAKARTLYQNRMFNNGFQDSYFGDIWYHGRVVVNRKEGITRFRIKIRRVKVDNGQISEFSAPTGLHHIGSISLEVDPDAIESKESLMPSLGAVIIEMLRDGWKFAPNLQRSNWYSVEFIKKR